MKVQVTRTTTEPDDTAGLQFASCALTEPALYRWSADRIDAGDVTSWPAKVGGLALTPTHDAPLAGPIFGQWGVDCGDGRTDPLSADVTLPASMTVYVVAAPHQLPSANLYLVTNGNSLGVKYTPNGQLRMDAGGGGGYVVANTPVPPNGDLVAFAYSIGPDGSAIPATLAVGTEYRSFTATARGAGYTLFLGETSASPNAAYFELAMFDGVHDKSTQLENLGRLAAWYQI